jgi:NADH:ubiquinone reductase (H+-translocating)
MSATRPRIVVIGAGFAGFHAARTLVRLARGAADIAVINPTDYFLYAPLLPEVAIGLLEPRRVTVPLADHLPGVRLLLGHVDTVDLPGHRVGWYDAEDNHHETGWDRLVFAAGSVNKLLPVPGVTEHAHGFRGLPEALYLRDHMTRQMELADIAADPRERAARRTFVVVGAGYTGTEVAAHGSLFTGHIAARRGTRPGPPPRWLLLDLAERVLPELDPRLSRTAAGVLERRGVEVRTSCSVREAARDGVYLTDGECVATRTLVWCVGVRPDPLVADLGLPTERGRLAVDEYLTVPGHPDVFACGDAAAVPDPARPGELTTMTAQHAVRQGRTAARNVAASCGHGRRRPYRYREIGFAVDLGGAQAAANPFGVPLSGLPAKAATRGYHLASLPGNRARVATEWLLDVLLPRPAVQLGLVRGPAVPLENAAPELPVLPRG